MSLEERGLEILGWMTSLAAAAGDDVATSGGHNVITPGCDDAGAAFEIAGVSAMWRGVGFMIAGQGGSGRMGGHVA